MTGYYGIITADVLHDKLLKPAEKLCYCEITASIGTGRFCILDPKELAESYECTETTIRNYIASLEKRCYIQTAVVKGNRLKITIKK